MKFTLPEDFVDNLTPDADYRHRVSSVVVPPSTKRWPHSNSLVLFVAGAAVRNDRSLRSFVGSIGSGKRNRTVETVRANLRQLAHIIDGGYAAELYPDFIELGHQASTISERESGAPLAVRAFHWKKHEQTGNPLLALVVHGPYFDTPVQIRDFARELRHDNEPSPLLLTFKCELERALAV